jgi:CheY-like chemotaxis protein
MISIRAVDNSPSIRKTVSFTLQHAGYDVAMVNVGVETLDIVIQASV